MIEPYVVQPSRPINATIRPPGSKSITNRALVCAALADGSTDLCGALRSDDTDVMVNGLRNLGFQVEPDWSTSIIRVVGQNGQIPAKNCDLFVGNSGTTVRFLTALTCLAEGHYELDGIPRMRERPIEHLLQALQQWGADAVSERGNGCPPVQVCASGLAGGEATVMGDISSQYLTALLLVAPYTNSESTLTVKGNLVSRPYIDITLGVMRAFGASVQEVTPNQFVIRSAKYESQVYQIEPDASAASYFWGAAAITGGTVTVDGLSRKSLQGDVQFCDCLQRMGCNVTYGDKSISVEAQRPLQGIEVNMNGISDTVQTLAAVSLYANGSTTISGVAHIRHKETDRIADLAQELRKLGAEVDESLDGLRITPQQIRPTQVATYDDHRMAMSLALVGLKTSGILIDDPSCTAKTYPHFFRDLESISVPMTNG